MTKETYLKDLQAILERNDKQIAIEELEEVKAEIEELLEHCDSEYEYEEIYGIKLCVEILEEHIKELNNETDN